VRSVTFSSGISGIATLYGAARAAPYDVETDVETNRDSLR
jgi:hypothetical protein